MKFNHERIKWYDKYVEPPLPDGNNPRFILDFFPAFYFTVTDIGQDYNNNLVWIRDRQLRRSAILQRVEYPTQANLRRLTDEMWEVLRQLGDVELEGENTGIYTFLHPKLEQRTANMPLTAFSELMKLTGRSPRN